MLKLAKIYVVNEGGVQLPFSEDESGLNRNHSSTVSGVYILSGLELRIGHTLNFNSGNRTRSWIKNRRKRNVRNRSKINAEYFESEEIMR